MSDHEILARQLVFLLEQSLSALEHCLNALYSPDTPLAPSEEYMGVAYQIGHLTSRLNVVKRRLSTLSSKEQEEMSNYFKVAKGATSGSLQHTMSQADIDAGASGAVQFHMFDGERYYTARFGTQRKGRDEPSENVFDSWIPVDKLSDVPEFVRNGFKDAKPEVSGSTSSKPLVPQGDLRDPNWRNSANAKEVAAATGAGNLALRDTDKKMPHDGLPADQAKSVQQVVAEANQAKQGLPPPVPKAGGVK